MGDIPRITGYGKGWQEPLAKGRWARWRQRQREPATKSDYLWALSVPLLFFVLVLYGGTALMVASLLW